MAMQVHNPLEQFAVTPVVALPQFMGIDISITNSALFMILATLSVALFYMLTMSKSALVPGRWQGFAEVIYQFVDEIVASNAGHDAKKYFPFFFTIFLFILFLNMLGMIPYSFAPTSHIIVTFAMGALVFLGVTVISFVKKGPVGFFKHFIPAGLPLWIAPIVFLIELVSYLSRPFSLGIRLAANITAGHTLMKVIAGFVVPLGLLGVLPLFFIVLLTGLEFFVAILQAYVFTLLSSIYLSEALAEDHH